MIVGILSDTHGVLPPSAFAELADCDHIIHAGDICGPQILAELSTLCLVTAVLGNNDYPEYGSNVTDVADVMIGGVRFVVAHTPQQMRAALIRATRSLLPHVGVAVHGHTHIPEHIVGSDAGIADMVLCPGSVSRPRGASRPTIIKLTIIDTAITDVSFVELTR